MKLYTDLARWWPLMSAPEDYEEEAGIYGRYLRESGDAPARTVLELGSGGGNNAWFLKREFALTLVDPAEGMLAHSRRLNPECAHHVGDMRTFRLEAARGQFDRVFLHDAVCYMTTLEDLARAMETAAYHLRPGGAVVIAPDFVRETFEPGTESGGGDGPEGAFRYLEWTWDPDPADHTYLADYAFLIRDGDGSVRVEHDRHVEGVFPRADWLRLLERAGFAASNAAFAHSEVERPLDLFIGVRR